MAIGTQSHFFGLIVFLFLGVPAAFASSLCSYYRKEMPQLYEAVCRNGSASTKPAGANSSFSDSFNISSASLPTEPSSYGLETIGSQIRNFSETNGDPSLNFAIVKGFHKFGAGVSTSGNNTFYGNDVIQRLAGPSQIESFEPLEPATEGFTNLNLGTSIGLLDPHRGPAVTLGLSARYNKVTGSWGGGPALLLTWTNVSLGGGFTDEKISNFLPQLRFTSLLASARFSIFEAEINRLDSNVGYELSPIYILTTTMTYRKLIMTFARRKLSYRSEGDITQDHFALQYLFSKSFSAGFLYNYIPGTNSLAAQFFL